MRRLAPLSARLPARLRRRHVVLTLALFAVAVLVVPLGSAAGSNVTLSATALAFAGRAVGTTSEAQSLRLTNSGAGPLTISSVHIDGADAADFAQSIDCPVNPDTLAVGGSCTIYASFTPHGAGSRSATLSIGDDAGSSPQTVALSGAGVLAPHAALTPGALAFGAVQVGDSGAAQTVTLTNTGSATLALSSITLAGLAAGDFSRTTTCDLNAGLPAGASCTVDVVFAPHSGGDKAALLTLDDNAPDSPQSVTVGGTATAMPVASVGLSATTLTFGSETVGASSPEQAVTVTNTGAAPLLITGVEGSPDFAATSDCPIAPAALAAGASCTARVTFSPSATGARAGSLTVSDDAADSPQHVVLSGRGLAPGTYFSDDFESGSLSQWDALSSGDSTIALDATVANSGGSSARFTNNTGDQASRLYANLAGGEHAQSYTRFCFRIAAGLTDGIEIANGRAITPLYPLGIRRWVITYNPVTKGLEGYFFNEGLDRLDLYAANGRVLPDQWHCAELYLDESANGHAELWLDGVSVGSVSGDLATPDPYSRLYLWNQPSAGTVWFDDVKVGSTLSGPVGAAAANRPGGQLTLAPSTLAFGSQTTQTTSAPQTVTLTNTGGSPVTIAGIEASDDFGQTNNCPSSLAAGASCVVAATFTPSATGARAGTVTVSSDVAGAPRTFALSGIGLAPGTYLSDDFESGSLSQWDVLSSSGSTVALDSTDANGGSSSVRIANGSNDQSSRLMADLAGGGHAQSYTRFCFEIAPGLTQGIEIANGRAITADFPLGIRRWVITYNPVTKGLEGYFFNEGLDRLDLYAANGRVVTGRWYCAELYLDESSNGHAQLWLDGVPVGSVAGDLATPSPYSRLYLWNQPSAGTVRFDDVKVADAQIGPVGAGAAGLPGPQVALSPTTLTFGSQRTQTTSAGQSVTLTNTGAFALTISNIGLTGANAGDFAQTNNCPASLAAGTSCTASVTFTPTATGARAASLSITDDASGTPHTVALSGTGAAPPAPPVTPSPQSLAFGDQIRGVASAAQLLTLTNTGTQSFSVALVKVPDSSDFSAGSTCGGSVPVGGSCTVTVTFKPTMAGPRTGTLNISTSVMTLNISLTGTGTFPAGTFFMDDFEYGVGAWAAVGGAPSPNGAPRNGTRAALLAAGSGMYVDFDAPAQAESHTRFCFNLAALSAPTVLAQGRDTSGLNLWEIDYDNGRHGVNVYIWNASRARADFYVNNVVSLGTWSCADVDLNQSAVGGASVSLDGTTVASVNGNFAATAKYSRLLFWNAAAGGSVTIDDSSVTVS